MARLAFMNVVVHRVLTRPAQETLDGFILKDDAVRKKDELGPARALLPLLRMRNVGSVPAFVSQRRDFLMKRYMILTLPALALACLLCLPEASFAQGRGGRGGRGGYGGGYGGRGYYGGSGISIGIGGYGYGSGYGYGRGYYAPYYGSGYYASPYGYGNSYYAQPAYGDGIISAGYQSLYPPSGAVQTNASRAMVHVVVPPNAQVFFDDSPTSQTGPDRTFMTGPLEPGTYSYNISARWMENGKERRENRSVRVTPGQTAEVNFMGQAPLPNPQKIQ
jgi:uncharacterized protein (TIGR03000 family)